MELIAGLYENILDRTLAAAIQQKSDELQTDLKILDPEDSFALLADHIKRILAETLEHLPQKDRLNLQAEICNTLLERIGQHSPAGEIYPLSLPLTQLLAVKKRDVGESSLPRPDTPLSQPCLLTGTRNDPSLASQLKKELVSADRVDILCSFVKWTGLRLLEEELKSFAASGRRLRLLTTTYTGATDAKAVAFLKDLPGAEVRVSYDGRRTRLHAKAYLFHRGTGFSTAYVGSANLSAAALTDGLEWNVKVSRYHTPAMWDKIAGTFESYWNDGEFTPCRLASDLETFRRALERERGPASPSAPVYFNLTPYIFQREILDRLQTERTLRGLKRNLVVAATGTGKTMIAAFDYRRLVESTASAEHPRLLYIAHRREILQQAMETFRSVLRDQNFGALLTHGTEPHSLDHLFCTIQSFNSRNLACQLDPDYFDYLVIDESHHAPAHSYKKLLEWARPRLALGLTATPERTDDGDVLAYFGDRISAEIRLPEAIERGLLCPFHYFGISDTVDFSLVKWTRGNYDTKELNNLLTGNHARLQLVLDQLFRRLNDPMECRGLGFCVSIDHAEFMAQGFREAGIPSVALSSRSHREEREEARKQLEAGTIRFIFTVDLYNEGIDLPRVDTVLFLRPTASLTVFLQQLGRGLRLAHNKECLTVLDFVGQAHRRFRFDRRFRELLPDRTLPVASQVQEDFPYLPSGCAIQLERVARDHILSNIRQTLGGNRKNLLRDLAMYTDELDREPGLREFLTYFDMDCSDLYRKVGKGYQCLTELLGVLQGLQLTPERKALHRGLVRLASTDSPGLLRTLLELLQQSPPTGIRPGSLFEMLAVKLLGPRKRTPAEMLSVLNRTPRIKQEMRELCEIRMNALSRIPQKAEVPFYCPLEVHCSYSREEILAGLGHWKNHEELKTSREGVLYLHDKHCDVFFVTLHKAARHYSPTTMYRDYAIDEHHFHWQSQSTTSLKSVTGRRYIAVDQASSIKLLFVRLQRTGTDGLASPFVFLGPVDYVSHEGERPISLVWRLRHAIPASILPVMRRLAM